MVACDLCDTWYHYKRVDICSTPAPLFVRNVNSCFITFYSFMLYIFYALYLYFYGRLGTRVPNLPGEWGPGSISGGSPFSLDTGHGPSNHCHAYRQLSSSMAEAVVATEFFCPSIVRFLSKSNIKCSVRTVPMSDMVDVGNGMVYTVIIIALAMQSGSVK